MASKRVIIQMRHYFIYGLPIAGLLITLILIGYFVGIEGYSGWRVWLYCALPLIINLLIALPVWLYFKHKK
ncbi:hypothetical protein ACNAN0_00970 [Agrilactobacillus fermenti]|uniref:hypothetical protein n=1 Tax=Agrilactobacillus fermenti TaxID=2586909 RepID=UPI001E51E0D8|nr:hypothetical protein [Agrilactobacillus fermenti]MCD2257431.1 hypothetical protein [Agrilactobacillus fermenti]